MLKLVHITSIIIPNDQYFLLIVPEVKMSHMLSDVEWYLFRNHRVDFNGNCISFVFDL